MNKKNCIICGKPLNSGIIIKGRRICASCEKRIVKCHMDTDFYEYYKNCIKRNFASYMLRGEDLTCQDYHF
ncbi:sigma factor G inhibitor Gin [Haloimpatiens sp. FM7315]|uniref:sigma factor G inhibitor Gin n=1 Tax=Haloimpatiens sp. FM7315 TaxID=3298609 RepID=UPI0035A2FF89